VLGDSREYAIDLNEKIAAEAWPAPFIPLNALARSASASGWIVIEAVTVRR
jgi:hypothetical protein